MLSRIRCTGLQYKQAGAIGANSLMPANGQPHTRVPQRAQPTITRHFAMIDHNRFNMPQLGVRNRVGSLKKHGGTSLMVTQDAMSANARHAYSPDQSRLAWICEE
ncbi:hypothetical protein AD951_06790 [Acetobacter malorum]|uniref:Uncharacterized protein n=1 Tax=Acetobacter malorum TaxID=178901 RepID=A0A149UN43_9PROT|nr:hypothetical protein AD951_06790 [Acetobacter malorum]